MLEGTSAGFYVNENGSLLQSSYAEEAYREGGLYRPRSGSYGDFWSAEGNEDGLRGGDRWTGYYTYNRISNNRDEYYVSGLQYAVEQAAKRNENLGEGKDSVEVWVGAGIYTDYKGFVIRDKVKVLGGFPNECTPGEDDRHPLLSDYISARDADEGLTKSDYETILQVRKETPVTWNNLTPSESDMFHGLNGTQRHYVLYQPDVCADLGRGRK